MPVVIGNKLEEIANTYDFNFIDLCAGIGGFHQAMSKLGGRCVGASEIDAMCMETYQKNFNDVPMLGDLTEINDVEDIEEAKTLVDTLSPYIGTFKVGLQLF